MRMTRGESDMRIIIELNHDYEVPDRTGVLADKIICDIAESCLVTENGLIETNGVVVGTWKLEEGNNGKA
jgi:hypothetical protein